MMERLEFTRIKCKCLYVTFTLPILYLLLPGPPEEHVSVQPFLVESQTAIHTRIHTHT